MKLKLTSVGNPDFGQDPNRPLYGCRSKIIRVDSFEEASKKCLEYISQNDLGSGNWSGGQILGNNNELVGYVSYNGRVWKDEEFNELIYDVQY